MSDCMHFPDTVEEFMEQYKMTDTKQVYSNGIEYVPIFRMKQWFEHEKAQLSSEGATSDLISRQAARHALCKAVHNGEDIPCENQTASCLWTGTRVCDFVREIDALPTIQPEKAQLSPQDTTFDLISRQAAIDALSLGKEMLSRVLDDIDVVGTDREKYSWGLGLIESYINDIKDLPTAQPDENAQEFIKLTARYSNGRPYYSIIYLEYDKNGVGHDFAGYSSYSLDIISDYLKKYFMPPAQPEPKEGHWINGKCDLCGEHAPFWCMSSTYHESNYCPNCGAKMKGERQK